MVATKDYRVSEPGLSMTAGTPAAAQRGLGLLNHLSARFQVRSGPTPDGVVADRTPTELGDVDRLEAGRHSVEAELWLGRSMRLA